MTERILAGFFRGVSLGIIEATSGPYATAASGPGFFRGVSLGIIEAGAGNCSIPSNTVGSSEA